ncbi:MAG: 50S ribosomal protein L6 [Planctomycetota bacterium]|jgi:large subunit ribosomal protein L6
MSRIGKQPVPLPEGVEVSIDGRNVTVKGPGGALTHELHAGIDVKQEESRLLVTRTGEDKRSRSLHGLTRALLQNHVHGVTQGYRKHLEIVGVSYQAFATPQQVTLKVGYANDVVLDIPEGVILELPNPTSLIVRGPDKQKVGQFAAEIRAARPPEPYKGKGIRFRGEQIHRKQGKSFVGSE